MHIEGTEIAMTVPAPYSFLFSRACRGPTDAIHPASALHILASSEDMVNPYKPNRFREGQMVVIGVNYSE